MTPIWIVAKNTFREVIRDRILYGLFIFAFLLVGLSLLLGQLSYAEQSRITADVGLMAIHLGAVGIAIFVGSTLVRKEIEKQTVLTVLARPLSRGQFIIGKFAGLGLVICISVGGLAVILLGIFSLVGMHVTSQLVLALAGMLLESFCLLGFTLLFSVFATPAMVVCFSIGIFLIGHWFSSLRYFSQRAPGSALDLGYKFLHFVLPDFESLNWKNLVTYGDPIQGPATLIAIIYAVLWIAFLVTLTAALFERKDLV